MPRAAPKTNLLDPDPEDDRLNPNVRHTLRALRAAGVSYIVEYNFNRALEPDGKGRNWRHDVYLPDHNIAIEIEGGLGYGFKSAHTSFYGSRRDIDKYSVAQACYGIYVYRTTSDASYQRRVVGYVLRHIKRVNGNSW